MKKKLITVICIIMFACVSVFAAGQVSEIAAKNRKPVFERMIAVMEEKITDEEEYNNLLINYMYLIDGYGILQNEADYIAEMISDGYDMTEVLECAYFWLDTNENISIIKEMCEIKKENDKYNNTPYWAEEIFNVITNEKYGALTEEDIIEYRKKGLTDEEILTANRLCRKGVYTIQQILEKRLSGEELADITYEIENGGNTSRAASKSKQKLPKLKKAKDVLACRELGRLNKTSMDTFVERAAQSEDAEEMLEEKQKEILGKVVSEMKNKKMLKKIKKHPDKKITDEIEKAGIKKKDMETLLEEHDELEILNAAKVSQKTGENINELMKKRKKGESWDKIVEEAEK